MYSSVELTLCRVYLVRAVAARTKGASMIQDRLPIFHDIRALRFALSRMTTVRACGMLRVGWVGAGTVYDAVPSTQS